MTTNQLKWQELQEARRHNVVSEDQNWKLKTREMDIDFAKMQETIRHNMTDEQIRNMLALIEQGKLDLANKKWTEENQREWAKLIGDWAYTFFSRMPLDATEGFANWGKGMQGVAAMM